MEVLDALEGLLERMDMDYPLNYECAIEQQD